MSFFRNLVQKFTLPFHNPAGRDEYPLTFQKELNYQSSSLLFLCAFVMSLAWLSYIPLDRQLHPDEPLIVFLRFGLTATGLLLMILHLSNKFFHQSLFLFTAGGAYLVIATGLISALSKGDSVYVGGYLFILTILAVVPLRRRSALFILYVSLAVFFGVGFLKGMNFDSERSRYSLNDLISTTVVSTLLIILLDGIRFRSWQKSRKIVEQREELKADKGKIDKLLLNILPAAIAEELKEKGSVKPVFHKAATIVFTDFVSFTKISENLTPEELVSELDALFSVFDSIMEKHSLEKLKTIGDSYMYAGGIPVVNNTHAVDAVLAAIEIQDHMNKRNNDKLKTGSIVFELRIGINSGPIMAGVVGAKKFVYDVWGNSVNFASRMESAGETGRINISRSTHELVKDFFDTEFRGQIVAKSSGAVDMYFITRIKSELSLDSRGSIPNERFLEMYRKIGNS